MGSKLPGGIFAALSVTLALIVSGGGRAPASEQSSNDAVPLAMATAAQAKAHAPKWATTEVGTTTFTATACGTSNNCFAFGLGGTLATSNDGGGSWAITQEATLSAIDVLSAACLSSTDCVAIGNEATASTTPGAPSAGRGVALTSTDGGVTWSRGQVTGAMVHFYGSLSCPARQTCYAVASGTSQDAATFLLVTNDGGTMWGERRKGPSGGLSGLTCLSAQRCLATGGDGILATSNGGSSWRQEREPMGAQGRPEVDAVACSTMDKCVAVGTGPPGVPIILVSQGHGSSWQYAPVAAPPPGQAPPQGIFGGYNEVSCAQQHCVATSGSPPQGVPVAQSYNGGTTWSMVGIDDAGTLPGVTCTSSGACIAAGSLATGSPVIAVGDANGAWSLRYRGPATYASALSCPTAQYCVAGFGTGPLPEGAAVAISNDGGTAWEPGDVPAGILSISALQCATKVHCLASGQVVAPKSVRQDTATVAALLVSGDGGRTWRREPLHMAVGTISSIACPTSAVCYAVGAEPQGPLQVPGDVILKTTDGGAKWAGQRVPAFPQPPTATSGAAIPGEGLTSISCFTSQSCVTAGPAGALATTDGQHWEIRHLTPTPGYGMPEANSLFGQLQLLACPRSSLCVGVFTNSNGGENLRLSADGARLWHTEASIATFSANALVCPTTTECLAAGSSSHGALLLESTDGGHHWAVAPLPWLASSGATAPAYTAVSCTSAAYCVTLGQGAVGEVAVAQ